MNGEERTGERSECIPESILKRETHKKISIKAGDTEANSSSDDIHEKSQAQEMSP